VRINKNWKPDWQLKTTFLWIDSNDGSFSSMLDVELFEESPGNFRIYSDPMSEELFWGDLIEAEICDDDSSSIIFKDLIERVSEKLPTSILSRVDSKDLSNDPFLKSITANGGYWEVNFGGVLNAYKLIEDTL
jgi:hypothetical protein